MRHLQHWVEIFFEITIIDGSLKKVKYHDKRVEFQVCEILHIHFFMWVIDALALKPQRQIWDILQELSS